MEPRRSSRTHTPLDSQLSEEDKIVTILTCKECSYRTHRNPKHICEKDMKEHYCPGAAKEESGDESSNEEVESGEDGEEKPRVESYTEIREKNMERNALFLSNIGLGPKSIENRTVPVATIRKRKDEGELKEKSPPKETRRSSRLSEFESVREEDISPKGRGAYYVGMQEMHVENIIGTCAGSERGIFSSSPKFTLC